MVQVGHGVVNLLNAPFPRNIPTLKSGWEDSGREESGAGAALMRKISALQLAVALAGAVAVASAVVPASAATARPVTATRAAAQPATSVPAERAYPILIAGSSVSDPGTVTDIGPTWEVSIKLPVTASGLGRIAIAPNGKYAYVLDGTAVEVISGVNTAHPKVAASVKPGGTPDGIVLTPNGSEAYVSVYASSRTATTTALKVLSGASTGKLKLAASLSFGTNFAAVNAITPDGKYAYATGSTALWPSVLWQIDGIATGHPRVTWSAVLGVRGTASWVTPNGKYLYVTTGPLAYGAGFLYKTESAKPERVTTFPFPAGANILITPNGHWAYASYWYINSKNKITYDVQVISGAQTTPKLGTRFQLADNAIPDAIQPNGNYAYGISSTGNGLTKTGALVVLSGASAGHIKAAAIWKLPYAPQWIAVSPVR